MNNLLLFDETTKHLTFRKLEQSDFEAWLPFHQDPRSSEFWNGIPQDPIQACTEQFERLFERYENNLRGMNALVHKTTGKLIGMAGILMQTVDEIQELEIGYSILPSHWKNGYASEAAKKCKTFAMEHKLSKSLISIIHIDNTPSQKVAIKNGMTLDKTTTYKNNPAHVFRITL